MFHLREAIDQYSADKGHEPSDLATLVLPGADSPVTIGLNSAIEGTSTGLTQLSNAINWHYVSATEIDGIVGEDTTKVVFTIVKVGSDYQFTLKDNIDNHPTAAGDNDTDPLSLAGVFTATDTDGDAVVINHGLTVNIENDVPI